MDAGVSPDIIELEGSDHDEVGPCASSADAVDKEGAPSHDQNRSVSLISGLYQIVKVKQENQDHTFVRSLQFSHFFLRVCVTIRLPKSNRLQEVTSNPRFLKAIRPFDAFKM
jgi:hypothetical protein